MVWSFKDQRNSVTSISVKAGTNAVMLNFEMDGLTKYLAAKKATENHNF
jgi:hypothetical protein